MEDTNGCQCVGLGSSCEAKSIGCVRAEHITGTLFQPCALRLQTIGFQTTHKLHKLTQEAPPTNDLKFKKNDDLAKGILNLGFPA